MRIVKPYLPWHLFCRSQQLEKNLGWTQKPVTTRGLGAYMTPLIGAYKWSYLIGRDNPYPFTRLFVGDLAPFTQKYKASYRGTLNSIHNHRPGAIWCIYRPTLHSNRSKRRRVATAQPAKAPLMARSLKKLSLMQRRCHRAGVFTYMNGWFFMAKANGGKDTIYRWMLWDHKLQNNHDRSCLFVPI